jgi:hypothetical protein
MKPLTLAILLAFLASPILAQEAIPTPAPEPAAAPTPAPTPEPVPPDRFYIGLGIPTEFSFNTYPALDPLLNDGRTSDVPNGAWTNGLSAQVGFEKGLSSRFFLQLEMSLMTMDINQLLIQSWDFPPRKTGATLFNASLGVKAMLGSNKPVLPYLAAGFGVSAIRVGQMRVLPTGVVVPEYIGTRLLARAGAGLDIRCDDEMTAFIEVRFNDMDTLNLLAPGPDISAGLFQSGLRLAM